MAVLLKAGSDHEVIYYVSFHSYVGVMQNAPTVVFGTSHAWNEQDFTAYVKEFFLRD